MEALKQQVENLIDNSQYDEAVNLVAKEFGIKLKVISSRYGLMDWDKKQSRHIFKMQLKRGKKAIPLNLGKVLRRVTTNQLYMMY